MNSVVLCLLLYVLSALATGSVGLFVCFLLYLGYLHKLHEHLPSPPRSGLAGYILGHLPAILEYKRSGRTFFHYLLDKRMIHGPVYVIFFVHNPLVVVGDPSEVRKICIDLKDDVYKNRDFYERAGFVYGERGMGYGLITNTDKKSWHRRRQLMNPAFHRKCLKEFLTDFNEVCGRFLKRMDCVAQGKQEVSMLKEFCNVTMDIISQVAFHVNVESIENPASPFPLAFASHLRGIQANIDSPLNSTFLSIFQLRLFQSTTQKEQIRATKFLRKFAFECISNRLSDIKAGKKVPDDLLGLLINDKSLTIDDIIDEVVTVFVAGHETTANTLAFALYEIVQHPDVEAKVFKEIEDVIGRKDYVDYEDLVKLKYLGKVMQESLRKYPVAGGAFRTLNKEVLIGGYQIPKGDMVISYNYVFSYNPDVWPNPSVFDPERFNAAEKIPNFTSLYFPFSLGPRNCIGQVFAKFEFLVILARVLYQFQFSLLPGQTNAIEERLTIAPRDGVMCKVIKRYVKQ